jgi:VanZ family protein
MIHKVKVRQIIPCILTAVYAYVIFLVSSRDTSSLPLPYHTDKLVHFAEFGLFCLLTCWSLFSIKAASRKIFNIVIAIGITSLYGVSDEFHQSFVPHRSMDILDWLTDTAGAVTAGFLWKKIASKPQTMEKFLAKEKTLIKM